jgi:hypothetical protein
MFVTTKFRILVGTAAAGSGTHAAEGSTTGSRWAMIRQHALEDCWQVSNMHSGNSCSRSGYHMMLQHRQPQLHSSYPAHRFRAQPQHRVLVSACMG